MFVWLGKMIGKPNLLKEMQSAVSLSVLGLRLGGMWINFICLNVPQLSWKLASVDCGGPPTPDRTE